jgi:hypothetical protein
MGTRARPLNMFYPGTSALWADNMPVLNIQESKNKKLVKYKIWKVTKIGDRFSTDLF